MIRFGLALAAVILAWPWAVGVARAQPRLTWVAACPVSAPQGTRCAELRVPERRDGRSRRTVIVPVAVVPAPSPAVKPEDPVLFLMGGSGAGFQVLDKVGALAAMFGRDVIVVEQRGNPLARPFFGCESVPTQGRLHMIWGSTLKYGPGLVQACRREIVSRADLNGYMTPAAADDLVDLRRLLGVRSWNVFGVSYGARVATTLLRKDPEGVRAVMLDSGQITGANFSGWDRIRALGEFFDRCATAPRCGSLFPDLRGAFERTVQRLHTRPAPILAGGRRDELHGIDVIDLVEFAIYNSGLATVERVPAAIMAADRGDYAPLLALRGIHPQSETPPAPMAAGYPAAREAHIAQQIGMLCAEEYAYRPAEYGMEQARGWSSTIRRLVLAAQRRELQVCRDWAFGREDRAQASPPTGGAPTLILNGDHDPVAPAWHGRLARDSLAHAQQVVFAWTGHAVVVERPACAASLLVAFVTAPQAPLDASCAGRAPEPNWAPTAEAMGS